VEKYTTEIVLQNYSGTIVMLDSRAKGNGSELVDNSDKSQFSNDDLDDEIPF